MGLESGIHFYNFNSDEMIIKFYRKNKQMILQYRLMKSCIKLTWWINEKVKHQLQDYEVNTTLKQKFKI
jgi:hypothetical protein